MRGSERPEYVTATESDPIDALLALADACRATALARSARRIRDDLESNRLFVSVVGSSRAVARVRKHVTGLELSRSLQEVPPVSVTYARRASHVRLLFKDRRPQCVPLTFHDRPFHAVLRSREIVLEGSPDQCGIVYRFGMFAQEPSRRLILVDEHETEHVPRESRDMLRVLVVDTTSVDDLARASARIEAIAVEAGATEVEPRLRELCRHLYRRLQQHLVQQRHALIETRPTQTGRLRAFQIARALLEGVVVTRSRIAEEMREQLLDWLSTTRRKFVMANKVDALLCFGETFAARTGSRRQLRKDAVALAHEIAGDLLAALWKRLSRVAHERLARHAAVIVTDLEAALANLGEALPDMGMASVLPILGFHRERFRLPSPALAHRVRVAGRRRIEEAARDELITELEQGSRQIVKVIIEQYEDSSREIERRLYDLLDGTIASAQLARGLGEEAYAKGATALSRARGRIDHWTATWSAIGARME